MDMKISLRADDQGLEVRVYSKEGSSLLLQGTVGAEQLIHLAQAFDRVKDFAGDVGPVESYVREELRKLADGLAQQVPDLLEQGARIAKLCRDLASVG